LDRALSLHDESISKKMESYQQALQRDLHVGDKEIAREAWSSYEKELRRLQLEKVAIGSRQGGNAAEARSLDDQIKWLREQVSKVAGEAGTGNVQLSMMRDELENERQVAKRLKTYREETRVELEFLSWITIR